MSDETRDPGVTRTVGVDPGVKDEAVVCVREGSRLIYVSPPGARLTLCADGRILVNPNGGQPCIVHPDGHVGKAVPFKW